MISVKMVRKVEFLSQLFQLCPQEHTTEGVWWHVLRAAAKLLGDAPGMSQERQEQGAVTHLPLKVSSLPRCQTRVGLQQGSTEVKAAAAVQPSSLLTAMMLTGSTENPIARGNSALRQTHFLSFSAKWLWQGPTTLWREVLSELEKRDIYIYNFSKSLLLREILYILEECVFDRFIVHPILFSWLQLISSLLKIIFLNRNTPVRSAGCGISE